MDPDEPRSLSIGRYGGGDGKLILRGWKEVVRLKISREL